MIAIDNLPSLLPLESSQDFAAQLLPHLHDAGRSTRTASGPARASHISTNTCSESNTMTIHWCGTGLSAIPGLKYLLREGREVQVWNRSVDKAQAALGDLHRGDPRLHA